MSSSPFCPLEHLTFIASRGATEDGLCPLTHRRPRMSAEEEKKEEPTKVAAAAEVRAPLSPKTRLRTIRAHSVWAGIISGTPYWS